MARWSACTAKRVHTATRSSGQSSAGYGRFDEMVAIAEKLPEITDAAKARLDRAMAGSVLKFDADRLAHLLDKRDQLLALADAGDKLTHGATGAA